MKCDRANQDSPKCLNCEHDFSYPIVEQKPAEQPKEMCGTCRHEDGPSDSGACLHCGNITPHWVPKESDKTAEQPKQICETCLHENEPSDAEPCFNCTKEESYWVSKDAKKLEYSFNADIVAALAAGKSVWMFHERSKAWLEVDKNSVFGLFVLSECKWSLTKPKTKMKKDLRVYLSLAQINGLHLVSSPIKTPDRPYLVTGAYEWEE